MKILISAGEASGDLYAAALTEVLKQRHPDWQFFGCPGPRMRASGVEAVIDASKLGVVGLVEVITHIPGIYREFRRLIASAAERRPDLAILTDSPDFHLRVARQLHRRGVPVLYLVAPQAWAWRQGRVKAMRGDLAQLFCIFPFEEKFFRERGVPATYIGHPLARRIRPSQTASEFRRAHRLDPDRPLVALLPGSRPGEIRRHLPILSDAVAEIAKKSDAQYVLGAPMGIRERFFVNQIDSAAIKVVVGETWNLLAAADLALAASGTVTMEAALLGTPMVTFYRVTGASWLLGKMLVRTPFYTMVNLIAEKKIVPELMQNEANGGRLAAEALRLLNDPSARDGMKRDLAQVAAKLLTDHDPMEKAADLVEQFLVQSQ